MAKELVALTSEQKSVLDSVLKFDKDIQTIAGYAGTGKTTLVAHLTQKLKSFAVCAFTGKAANVLRQKGIAGASTIHSLIYEPERDELGNIVLINGSPNFVLKDQLLYDGVIVDESSMVGKDIYKDLCSFGLPLVFVGDHGQLEPVGEGINLMKNPQFKLETIHRNAGEIAHFAEHIRKGFRPAAWQPGAKVQFIDKYDADDYFLKMDQIICAYNKTRVQVNLSVRQQMDIHSNWPVVNDRVMCLKNNKEKMLFNGMQGIVDKFADKPRNKFFFTADDSVQYEVVFDPSQFNKVKYDFQGQKDDPAPFDFAYCITAHKSQGSEWGKVMVLEQKCDLWEHKRWAYTAASRARDSVIWVPNY